MGLYGLDDAGEAVPCLESGVRCLDRSRSEAWRVGIDHPAEGVEVSTVFLGFDHRNDDGPPLLWETMAFAHEHQSIDQIPYRCTTRAEAVAQHARVLAETRAHIASCAGGCEWSDE